jgi:nucleotide-binding universal stress UspA family protein
MDKIKNIIVPTDFSVTARNAYQYALGMAEALDASITVVHVKEYFIPVSELNVAPFTETNEDYLNEAIDNFIAEEYIDDGDTLTQSKVKPQILRGNPVSSLLELSAQEDTDLIVIGTTGLQDFITQISGSVSVQVANRAHCPVLLVPRGAPWLGMEQLLYASNFESMTPNMIGEATDFARFFESTTHFVHVGAAGYEADKKEVAINWDHLFSQIDAHLTYRTHSIFGSNTTAELEKYAKTHHINLMVFVSKHRSFWANLLHKSIIQSMAIATEIPMLVMHVEDEW